jgi:adenylate kinase
MVHFTMPTLQSVKRLKERGKSPQRRSYDMSTDIILRRLEEFDEITAPAARYYQEQNKYYTIDGNRDADIIFDELVDIVDKAARKAI